MLITRAVASTTVIVASASTVSPLRSQTDIDDLVSQNPAEFLWDIVFVDEGQDWPVNEIEILRSIYSPERIIVADGVDQFVRTSVATGLQGSRGTNFGRAVSRGVYG